MKKMDYGTILVGPMYYQYLIPQQVRHSVNIVLVHGGGGQGEPTTSAAAMAKPGWAHYFAQAGYKTLHRGPSRPGPRALDSRDSPGPIGAVFNYDSVVPDFKRGAQDPNRRWVGSADANDPHIQQFQAGQNSTPTDNAAMHKLWASRGAEMLDRIGPSIIVVHFPPARTLPVGW